MTNEDTKRGSKIWQKEIIQNLINVGGFIVWQETWCCPTTTQSANTFHILLISINFKSRKYKSRGKSFSLSEIKELKGGDVKWKRKLGNTVKNTLQLSAINSKSLGRVCIDKETQEHKEGHQLLHSLKRLLQRITNRFSAKKSNFRILENFEICTTRVISFWSRKAILSSSSRCLVETELKPSRSVRGTRRRKKEV